MSNAILESTKNGVHTLSQFVMGYENKCTAKTVTSSAHVSKSSADIPQANEKLQIKLHSTMSFCYKETPN